MPVETNIGSLNGTRTFNNFVGSNDPLDRYSFNLTSAQNVNLALTGLSADADLRLFRASSSSGSLQPVEEIAKSELGSNRDESINRFLTAGNYIIDVDQYEGNTNYTLRISNTNTGAASNLLPTEVNIGALNNANTFTGVVNRTNTADVYRFSLETASNLRLSLHGLSADADVRIVRDGNGNRVVDNGAVVARSNRRFNFNEAINRTLAAGEYYIQVYQGNSNANTHYRLGLSATAVNSPSSRVDLVGQFGTVSAPDIRIANDNGQAQFVVSNQGQATTNGPVTVRLYASTDQNYDSNDELLGNQTLNINLASGQSQTYSFNFDAPTVVAPGSYHLLARIDANNAIAETSETNNLVSQHVSAPGTDVVLDWNATLLNAIQSVATAPPLGARAQAIVHAAIYDAVNAIDRSYSAFHIDLNDIDVSYTAGASVQAAAAAAAHRVLSDLFPSLSATFDLQLQRSLSEVVDGDAETRGIEIGEYVADLILVSRLSDGSAGAQVPYTPGTAPGSYQSTNADGTVVLPNWGQVTPFAISNAEAFRPSGPPVYGSAQYATELNQVQRLGGYTSSARTADQSEIAVFWALDRPDTFRPPGHWNQIAQTVALQEGNSVVENARLFALLNIAQADAGIVAWEAKYAYNQLRPISAVHLANSDGNSQTFADPNWQSFLPTPPFPDYISGHATFGGAAAEVLTYFFGNNYQFTATSQELPGVYRSFDSFREAATENSVSRLYGGVHVQSANLDGQETGAAVANYILRNYLV